MKSLLILPAAVLALVLIVNCQEDASTPFGADAESITPRAHHNPGHGGGGGPGGGGKEEVQADISTTGAFTVTGTQPVERDNKNNFWLGRAIVNGTTNFSASAASPACTLDDPSNGGSDGGGSVAGRLEDALVDAVSKDRAIGRFRVFKNILGEPGHGVSVNSDAGKIGEDLGTVAVQVTGATVSANVPANQCCIPSVLTFTGGNLRAITRWDEDGDEVLDPTDPIAALECPHLDTLVATISEPTP
jgi:hypothetical protein